MLYWIRKNQWKIDELDSYMSTELNQEDTVFDVFFSTWLQTKTERYLQTEI